MFVIASDWYNVSDQFSEEEKRCLRDSVRGGSSCPNSWFIDETILPLGLGDKLRAALYG